MFQFGTGKSVYKNMLNATWAAQCKHMLIKCDMDISVHDAKIRYKSMLGTSWSNNVHAKCDMDIPV